MSVNKKFRDDLSFVENIDDIKKWIIDLIMEKTEVSRTQESNRRYYAAVNAIVNQDRATLGSCKDINEMRSSLNLLKLIYGDLSSMISARYGIDISDDDRLLCRNFEDKLASI